jgi:hypothetical protein
MTAMPTSLPGARGGPRRVFSSPAVAVRSVVAGHAKPVRARGNRP